MAIVAAALAAHYGVYGSFGLGRTTLLALCFAILLAGWLYTLTHLYRPWRGESKRTELMAAVYAWTVVLVLTAFTFYLTGLAGPTQTEYFVAWYLSGLVTIGSLRVASRLLLNHLRSRGRNQRSLLVVGDSGHAAAVMRRLRHARWTGYQLIGYVGDQDLPALGVPRLCRYESLERCLVNHPRVDQVWIAMPLSDGQRIGEILDQLGRASLDIRFVPDFTAYRLMNHSVSDVVGMPVINISVSPMNGANRLVKAIEDKLVAGAMLAFLSPVMLAIALGVKWSSPGPVFYRQERVSWNGRPFQMLKFRSMPVCSEEQGVVWGCARDKSMTSFGRFLRKTSLDELPQLFNVLKGDMSIVGPRPERTMFVEQFKYQIPGYMQKHMVKAGITGWAQVNGWRGDTDLVKRIECDLFYIENWSLSFDLKIILMTLYAGLLNRNAY
jgi:putative colanic acid biosynthesis UDP-glucose lipid carrier transferase